MQPVECPGGLQSALESCAPLVYLGQDLEGGSELVEAASSTRLDMTAGVRQSVSTSMCFFGIAVASHG